MVNGVLKETREKTTLLFPGVTKIEVHARMAERLVRDLAIEEALQEEIKNTLEHNNQSYGEWCAQMDKGKNNTSFS